MDGVATTHNRPPLRIGVVAMQGAFREHAAALNRLDVPATYVRTPQDLAEIDAIVIPGGESTAIRFGLVRSGLYDPLRERVAAGLPALVTCAGMVVLGHAPADAAPPTYGVLDVNVSRNGYGRQLHSADSDVEIDGSVLGSGSGRSSVSRMPFIRAPRIESFGRSVEPCAWLESGVHAGDIVAVRTDTIIACCFHPELTRDTTFHEAFLRVAQDRVHLSVVR